MKKPETPEEQKVGDEDRAPEDVEAEASADSEPQDELTKAKQQAAAHLDDLLRLKAEFENYRKRIMREQTELVDRASVGLVARLLTVLDNFDLAVASAEESRDFEKMLRGLELVYGELREVLKQEGLQPLEAKGRPFDPNLHEAALEVPGEESGELVVAEVLRPGYSFKDKVLRPAMVKVTRRSSENDEDADAESNED
ncbi:MAG: nucleotide exchange factor GrpE [Actinobacteria bacterium]|nr:nucleotide exchange factor GrpE [Actinomycetota bacterium]